MMIFGNGAQNPSFVMLYKFAVALHSSFFYLCLLLLLCVFALIPFEHIKSNESGVGGCWWMVKKNVMLITHNIME